jgi:hypothetical protein
MFLLTRARSSRQAGPALLRFVTPPSSRFDKMATQGGKPWRPKGKLPATAWRKERQWSSTWACPGAESITDWDILTLPAASLHFRHQHLHEGALHRERPRRRQSDAAVIGTSSGTTYRPAPGSGRRASGEFRRSIRPTITNSASICASR